MGVNYGGPHAVSAVRIDGTPLWQQKWKYDVAGNMVQRQSQHDWSLAWDGHGRLTEAQRAGQPAVSMAYGGEGALVRKTHADGTQSFYFGDHEIVDGERVRYYNFGSRRVAMRRGSAAATFLHGDHLRSIQLTTDDSGQVISRALVEPFGKRRYVEGASPTDFEFTGERRHGDLGGIYHMGARFYDPEIARWLSADSILPDPHSPQKLNRYSYVTNSPLRYVDPSGHDGCETNAAECDGWRGTAINWLNGAAYWVGHFDPWANLQSGVSSYGAMMNVMPWYIQAPAGAIPGLGDGMDVLDTMSALQNGNYGEAAFYGTLALAPVVSGPLLRGGGNAVASVFGDVRWSAAPGTGMGFDAAESYMRNANISYGFEAIPNRTVNGVTYQTNGYWNASSRHIGLNQDTWTMQTLRHEIGHASMGTVSGYGATGRVFNELTADAWAGRTLGESWQRIGNGSYWNGFNTQAGVATRIVVGGGGRGMYTVANQYGGYCPGTGWTCR